MNNLKDIHNTCLRWLLIPLIVLSGFQWTIWRTYTTTRATSSPSHKLFYQDFNEQFEGHTQHALTHELAHAIVLSGFQWTIWRTYTTINGIKFVLPWLFYQDFNEQFEGHTQLSPPCSILQRNCFIRISMNNLKDIHNKLPITTIFFIIVLSGFQWTIWRTYTTLKQEEYTSTRLFYQDFNEQFEGHTQPLQKLV